MRDLHTDTQASLDEDTMKWFVDYWKCDGHLCRDCPAKINGLRPDEFYQTTGCCDMAMTQDILARQRELDRKVKQ